MATSTGLATFYGGAPDGLDPYAPSFGTSDGSCGYGLLDKTVWPYWSVGALSRNNSFYKNGPIRGCGYCFEIQCLTNNGKYAGRCSADPNSRQVTIQITDDCPGCEADHIDLQALTFDKSVASRASVSQVQIRGKDSSWTNLNNIWGAVWELGWTPKQPLDVHIIQDDGQEVTAYGIIGKGGLTGKFPTGLQFKIGTNTTAPAVNPPKKDFGRCQSGWMLAGDASHPEGFCQQTCGRCAC
ncbi:hypothetical protein WJX72_004607 [[Myrmecia] bisecta]|uniref:Expansin-like EG45 domain-containing protein n=1 Tax=[Myrmecia] bisecta TaxID=41462 RepID=A0AAW1QEZ3_9CHLO